MKHIVGDIHPNGKWIWTEYKPGKFDWRGVKNDGVTKKEVVKSEQPKATSAVDNKPRTKKQFINETKYDLTKEECAEYWKMGKLANIYVCSAWNCLMGRIGNCSLRIVNSETCKEKDFKKHPNWRPLGHYSFSVMGYMGESLYVEGYVQSWDEIRNISDTSSFTVDIMRHPHQ